MKRYRTLFIIIFFAVCALLVSVSMDASKVSADAVTPPPADDSPEMTLDLSLIWYEVWNPLPHTIYTDTCLEVVGYEGILDWTAVEGQTGSVPGQKCQIHGAIGEITEEMIPLDIVEVPQADISQPDDYVLSISAYVRCIPPELNVDPEKGRIDVGENTKIRTFLACYTDEYGQVLCDGEPVILEVVSGPGELELPELSPDDLARVTELGYLLDSDKIIVTHGFVAEADLLATGPGIIEIEATYDSCRDRGNEETIHKRAVVHVGDWVSIDCTYTSDRTNFQENSLQWGGSIHCEVCLEAYDTVEYGVSYQGLRGSASGSQECWVIETSPDYWIENKNCPAFTGTVTYGAIWDTYDFTLDIDDSAALVFDECYGDSDRTQRIQHHLWDPVLFMETPIHLGADDDAVFIFEDKNMLNTEYRIEARWIN